MTDSQTAAAMASIQKEIEDTVQEEGVSLDQDDAAPTSADMEAALVAQTEALEEAAEWKERAARLAADMENLRKRTQKDVQDARSFAIHGFAKNLLSVADNMDRALEAIQQADASEDTQTLKEGVAMVAQQLAQAFKSAQIEKFTSMGDVLDPEKHQVMAQAPSDQPEHTVVQELQPGYTLAGRLLRPALVIVSNGETPAPQTETEETN